MQVCQLPEPNQRTTQVPLDNQVREVPEAESNGVAAGVEGSLVMEETEVIRQQAAFPFPMEGQGGRKSRIIPPSEALGVAVGLPIQGAEAVAIPEEPVAPMANHTRQEAVADPTIQGPSRTAPQALTQVTDR